MHVILYTTPARKTPFGYEMVLSFGAGKDTPRREIDARDMTDLLEQFATFKRDAEATGLPLKVDFRKHPRDTSRKFPGFDKAGLENHFTPAAETASEAAVHALAEAN